MKPDKRQQKLNADMRAQYWLSEMNTLEEGGKRHTKAYQVAERKAHFWLDRLNVLDGFGDGTEAFKKPRRKRL